MRTPLRASQSSAARWFRDSARWSRRHMPPGRARRGCTSTCPRCRPASNRRCRTRHRIAARTAIIARLLPRDEGAADPTLVRPRRACRRWRCRRSGVRHRGLDCRPTGARHRASDGSVGQSPVVKVESNGKQNSSLTDPAHPDSLSLCQLDVLAGAQLREPNDVVLDHGPAGCWPWSPHRGQLMHGRYPDTPGP